MGPIAQVAADGRKFCSMKKNDIAQGVSLVIARDTEQGATVALEFSNRSFFPGAKHNISISVGLLRREIATVAATKKVLLANIGQDPDFFDMLAAKDEMRISLSGTEHVFDLKGSARAIDKLADCVLVSGGAPVAVAEQKPVLPPVFSQAPIGGRYLNVSRRDLEEFNVGRQAMTSVMQDEVERLKIENRKLMLENHKIQQGFFEEAPVVENKSLITSRKKIPLPKEKTFQETVADYISGAAILCKGDFAHTLGPIKKISGQERQEAETACLGGEDETVSALLFARQDNAVAVTEYTGPPKDIETALALRQQGH